MDNPENKELPKRLKALSGGGEMGRLLRAFDWSKNDLGLIDTWPQSLVTAVSLMLDSRFAMCIGWGPEFIQLYNDRFQVMIGSSKHLGALGAPFQQIFEECWHLLGPSFEDISQGKPSGHDDWLLPLKRRGYLEECYFDCSCSPIRDESGQVGGVCALFSETTDRVLSDRRYKTLRGLTMSIHADASGDEVGLWKNLSEAILANGGDIPFAALYRFDADHKVARCISPLPSPSQIELNSDAARSWQLDSMMATGEMQLIEGRLLPEVALKGQVWPEEIKQTAVMPISRNRESKPFGFVLLGVSPRLEFDGAYLEFFSSICQLMADAIAGARASDTERARAEGLFELENEARTERAKLTSIFHQAPVGIALLEGPDHIFTLTNPTYLSILFNGSRDLIGKSIRHALPELSGQGFTQLLDTVYGTGLPYVGTETPVELVQADGSLKKFYLNFVYQPLRGSEGIAAIVVDVTESVLTRRKLEEAIESVDMERSKFASIFADASTSMAVTHGPTHIYEHANPSYTGLFEGRDLVGKPLLEALPELRGQPFPELFDSVFATGTAYIDKEARAMLRRSPEGPLEERYFDQTYTRLLDGHGVPYGVFIHAFEVTERVLARRALQESESRLKLAYEELHKAKEGAEQANAAKSSFLANMSHEIRTPLGAVMGFVELIKYEDLPRRTLDEYLAIIQRNSNQLLRIIDDILDLSKVEAGMMLIEHIEFSLLELLSDFSSLMGFRARDKGISFLIRARSLLPDMVISDPTRIRQILTNIVGNAIKFTEQGSVELIVGFEEEVLEFEVRDSGPGISTEQEQGLFQPFSQGDISITRKFGGTGLGLVLTRRLSEALGGTFILKESALGSGSTFVATVKVPMAPGAKLVKVLGYTPAVIPDRSDAERLAGLKVLVVEDSPDNQTLVSILLRKSGAIVNIASDGAAGVAAALKGEYDVILMDVQMPIMDGITAVRILREKGYSKPVVALTAHAMKEERDRCLKVGFSDFLSKPIQREAIIGLLAHVAGRE